MEKINISKSESYWTILFLIISVSEHQESFLTSKSISETIYSPTKPCCYLFIYSTDYYKKCSYATSSLQQQIISLALKIYLLDHFSHCMQLRHYHSYETY